MRNIKLTLEYDGAAFYGFQRQPKHRTVQAALEKALSQLLNTKTKIAAASGRTDTGVHAKGQVVNFKTKSLMQPSQMLRGLNAILPEQIAVRKLREVPASFHARYDAKHKTYEYQIWNDLIRSPLNEARVHHVRDLLNVEKMRKAAKILTGKHDFKSFCASDPKKKYKSTIRIIQKLSIRKHGSLIMIQVQANGFLYHMVRNLVGALIEVGRGKLTPKALQGILKANDRRLAPQTAPAKALSMINVTY